MNSRRSSDDSCFCSSCLYKHNKAYRGIERTGSKIDKLYRDKYLPLRESKLIDKLERTRAVYDDIRAPVLADSEDNRNITNKKHRDSTELDKCCSCCRCTRKANNIIGDTDASSDYGYVIQSSKRRVRFKPEFIKSEPCVCLAKFSSLLKKHSEFLQSKLKREFSLPVLRNKIKETSSKQRSRIGKVLKLTEKISDSKAHFQELMLELSVNKMPKSRDKVENIKQRNNYKGPKYQKEQYPTLCPCPQEKLVLKIRKDSIRKFYEDLEKKRTLKHLECKSECIQDICIPKECLDKIKLSKGKKSPKKQKKTEKQRKSLKQIVSKASRRNKKRSVMCQCDDTSIPTKESDKQQTYVRQNKVKFVPSKKGIRDKSYLKSNQATLDKPQSKTDDGNTLKRCFCTLKFKPTGTRNISQKYSLRPELDYYPHSGQSGDMKISSMQKHKTVKNAVQSKSSCTVYDCDPNECLKDYKIRKRHTINPMAKKYKKLPTPSYILNATNQTKAALPESDQDNRRVLKIGSSISFNIEFFKENITKDSHKSVKTNTVPHYLSNKSIKSIRPQKSNKKITKHKRRKKVIIMDNLSKNGDLNLKKNMSSKILTKIKKYANSKKKKKTATKEIEFKETINEIDLKTEMVDQSTKITHKDKRVLKPFECEPQTCVPDNCDSHLCLKKKNNHKYVITTTDFPKMISVASGVHKRKLKHVQAQSKPHFRRKNSFAKSDLNTFEDNEQIYSNILPKMSNKNTLRLSSNFSFAIEIGRGVIPHMNPTETIKRYSSIYKAKKIKSRINNDNYAQRKDKSKKSVINSMVKRCMCTLNLSKQRNRNKSLNEVNENFTPNVYTVNTVTTSNFGPFSAKHMSENTSPCDVRKVSSNEYKCDINNYYAAWHSQIIYNNIHRKNIINTKLFQKNKLKRQLKKNLYLVSKSLSFLSDKEFKKNADWTPWYYAESKNITYESSDYIISKLDHVGKHRTFTKSSNYWEKSYCTMNLKTIYNRNGKTKKLMENDSQKNCVRVGSNINLNIEFYKKNLCLEAKNDMLPKTITRKDDSFRSKMTQDVISTSNKAAYSVPENQRCFCTFKLQKKNNTKHIEKSKQKSPSEVNLKSTVSYVSKSQNTPKIKGLKNIPNEISTDEKIMNTIRLVPDEPFFPRECIPGMCVPGQCDTATCYDILYKRKLKSRSISTATKTTKKIRAGLLTQQSSVKNAKTQSHNIESHKKRNERKSVPYSNIGSGNQCAKFGSNISFNIEFYKENPPTSKQIHYEPEVYDKKYSKSSKYADASVTTKTRDFGQTKLSARPRDSLIKRCFCTLKTQKKQKKPLLTEVHSAGVMAGVKNKWYSDKVLPNHVNMNKGDTASIYNTKSIIRKHKQSLTGVKETKSKLQIAMTTLLPYECEPGTCVPGACNPYECLQRIKARKLIKRDIGSVTTRHNKKSLGTMSKYGTPSKRRRIQTVSFQQNDSSVSNNRCVRIGSNINLSIEFFKVKNSDGPLPHKTIYKDNNVNKTTSPSYKPVINTKTLIPHVTKKHKETKHTLNKSQEPIVNFQMNVKKQTLSQLSQTRHKYFSKNKGLLRYECEPNVCLPGQCDPYKCYKLIQNRIYKDCSAVTVANVRDFATNATPCYTCKSKRIQTGHHHREGAGIKLMKSVLDHKSRNYIRISSNFGFHIEFCKKREDGPLRDVKGHDVDYKYKTGHSRLHDQASQSQYINSRSQSTYAKSKLQRCFCTKKFFNSFAKTENRNFEYTTNYCALIPNILPTVNNVHNINSSRDRQHFIYQKPFHLDNQKKCDKNIFSFKYDIKPKRLLKFRRNTSKVLDENKIKSYLSFDLELYKRKKFKKDLNKTQKKICSHQHILNLKQKSNIKKLKTLKTIDSKSIQGQGDLKKTVRLKRCYSTINFTRKYEKNCKTEHGLVDSRYETIQQALKAKGYNIKYIFTDSSEGNTFHLPQAKIIRWDEVHESLFNYNNMRFLCNTYPGDHVLSIKNRLIEIKKYKNLNYHVGNKEKCSYFRNVYNKLHPYADKIKFKQLFKNMKSRRRSHKLLELPGDIGKKR